VYCVDLEPGVANLETAGAVATPHEASGSRVYASTLPGACGGGTPGIQVNVWNSANALDDEAFTVLVP
jgi:hypothetical protein